MFYSTALLTIRKNKKGRFSKCWLAATVHQFVGSGRFQLSKKEVNAVDIASTCDDIINGISGVEGAPQLSLYLASLLTIGTLRIFQKQSTFLEDDSWSANIMILCPKQKDKKKKQGIVLDNQPEISFDASQLFPENQIDNNCIQEDCHTVPKDYYVVPEDFGELKIDDIRGCRLDDDPLAKAIADAQEFTNNPMAYHDRRESVQNMEITTNADSEAIPIQINVQQMSPKEFVAQDLPESTTPKRKSRRNHDDTPTKRDRVPIAEKMLPKESQAQVLPESTTPKRKSRRNHDDTPTKRDRIPTAVHFSIPNQPFPISGEVVHPSEMAESPSNASSLRRSLFGDQNSKSTNMVEPGNVPHEDDGPALPAAAAMVVDEAPQVQQPVDEIVIDEYTRPEENNGLGLHPLNDRDELHLDELNKNILPRSRRNKKKRLIIDKKMQISIKNLENPIFHTMERTEYQIRFPIRMSAKELLCLPSTGTGMFKSRISNCLGKTLKNFYVSWLTYCRGDALNHSQARSGHEETIRDPIANETGLSVGVMGAAEVSSDFVTPRPSSVHSRRLQTTGQILENEVDQEEPQAQFAISSTSPAPMSQQINTVRQSESGHVEHQVAESSSGEIETEFQRSGETSETSLDLWSMEQFLIVLKQMRDKSVELEGVPKVGLHEILPPAKINCKELLKYLLFIFDFERRGVLYIEQECIGGPVYITLL